MAGVCHRVRRSVGRGGSATIEPMTTVADVETRFADAWEAHGRAEIVAIREADDRGAVAAAHGRRRSAIDVAVAALAALVTDDLDDEDTRAVASMRETLGLLDSDDPLLTLAVDMSDVGADDRSATEVIEADGLAALLLRSSAAYTRAAEAVDLGGETVDRSEVLARLSTEPDPSARRRLFVALEPAWRAVDGDGGPTSPYRVALRASADAWRRQGSPVDANARSLGIDPAVVEPWLRAVLGAWRDATVRGRCEPWDQRYETGRFAREFDEELPTVDDLLRIDHAYYAGLGADPDALRIRYDVAPRPGRGPVAVAFSLDVGVPRRTADGWIPGEQWVIADYGRPRIPDLAELLHETGHAIHGCALRTRPAFAVMREEHTTLIEALGDLAAWDLYEPAWQARWLGRSVSLDTGLRARYADVVRDAAWALFEIVLHRSPERVPNEVWTEITEDYLGILPHPEWSWWAVRGQLVQSPGYMVNYGVGAIVTADLRARLQELRGDWSGGDPGWYAAVSEAIYRWGGEREPSDVLEAFLGRPVSPDAILADLRRLGEATATA